jgi:hypothetical protein
MQDMSFTEYKMSVKRTLAVRTTIPNVCKSWATIRLPETVYIVAGGPNGAAAALTIPNDACVVACNSSILMPRDFSWWVAFDYRIPHYGWWKTVQTSARKLFSSRLLNRLAMPPVVRQIRADYYFEYLPDIVSPTRLQPKAVKTPVEQFLMPSILRGGLTVSGIALQFAYYGGAKRIILCGVDLTGRGHWDNYTNPDPYQLCGGRWPWADQMQAMCDLLRSKGVDVRTCSKSALNLPFEELS